MTEDAKVQMQIMRLHGFSAMSGIMYEYPSDNEILLSVSSKAIVLSVVRPLTLRAAGLGRSQKMASHHEE
jgi:hypothetical protein